MPKVSVIIPVYNVEKYLRECLDSVINQTLKDIEIICVDDCSTDNSYEILQEYAKKDNRIIIKKHEYNKTSGAARNMGINIATSKYIMFLDPDDWYELEACEKAYNQITKNNDDLVFFNVFRYFNHTKEKIMNDKNNVFTKYEDKSFSLKDVKEPYMRAAWVWSQIYNLEFIKKNNITFSNTKYCQDVPFSFKALVSSKSVSLLNEYLYNYRKYNYGVKLSKERINNWKCIFYNKGFMYDYIMSLKEKDYYIQQYLIYYINSILYIYKPYIQYCKDKIFRKEFYNKFHQSAMLLDKEQNIDAIKFYINYSDFYDFVKYKNFNQYILGKIKSKIFSIKYKKEHKIFNILGFKLSCKIKKNKDINNAKS